jgi:hypothetical protein
MLEEVRGLELPPRKESIDEGNTADAEEYCEDCC